MGKNRGADRLTGALSLCRRAGKLALGFDSVKESVHKGNAHLILFAADVSPKTEENIRFTAEQCAVRCIRLTLTMDELWFVVGKRVGVAAVADRGMARLVNQNAAPEQETQGETGGRGEKD